MILSNENLVNKELGKSPFHSPCWKIRIVVAAEVKRSISDPIRRNVLNFQAEAAQQEGMSAGTCRIGKSPSPGRIAPK
jgi:hypothetical protein